VTARAAALVAGVLAGAVSGCAARGFVPPTGPASPAPEAPAALAQAARTCRGASTFRGATRLSGRVGEESIGSVGINAGLTPDGIYLQAQVLNSTVFTLGGRRDEAALWLRDDNVSLHAPAGDIVEALVGVRLEPDRLLAVLTGCVSRDLAMVEAQRVGRHIVVTTPDAVLYLREDHGTWRVEAGAFDGLVAEVTPGSGLPAAIRIRSAPGRVPCVDLRVRLSPPLYLNDVLDASIFSFEPPQGARPITLEDLREAGPLRTRQEAAAPCDARGT
jgi:hypothetical protein